MNYIAILLFVFAALVIFTGIVIALGVRREQRGQGVMFLLATLCAAVWIIAIGVFMILKDDAQGALTAPATVLVLYSAPLLMMIFMMAFLASRLRLGRVFLVVFLVYAVVLLTLLWSNPSLLYSAITLGGDYNSVALTSGWFYLAYSAYMVAVWSITLGLVLFRILRSQHQNERAGLVVMACGYFIVSIFCTYFNVILPTTRYDLIWVGPLTICILFCAYFYAAIRYHTIALSTKGLQLLSYLVITAVISEAYILIYMLAAEYIFQIELSDEMFVTNLALAFILVTIVPLFSGLSSVVKSLLHSGDTGSRQFMLDYNQSVVSDFSLRDLATAIANRYNFDYIGFVVNGQIYGSHVLFEPDRLVTALKAIPSASVGQVWQDFSQTKSAQRELAERDLQAVAELKNARGQAYGFLLVGMPLGKDTLEKSDLRALENTLNIFSTGIDSKLHLRVNCEG